MKKHNPLILNIVTDEPNYETDICKWWLCEISEHKRYYLYMTINKKTDEMNYVIVDNNVHEIIYHSQVLENALMHITMCDKADQIK